MASYRPFPPPPQSTFVPPLNQNPLPPPPQPQPQPQPPPPPLPPQPRGGNQYSQNWGGSYSQNYGQIHQNSNFQHGGFGPSSSQPYNVPPPRNQLPPPPPQQQYSYPPPPPPPDSSFPPPPPPSVPQNSINLPPQSAPAPLYYPSSQYSQYNNQPLQPPPPSSPPPSSAVPPPPPSQPPSPRPPPSSVPAAIQNRESRPVGEKRRYNEDMEVHSAHGPSSKHHKYSAPQVPRSNGLSGRIETEEERRLRKKREFEKHRQEEKMRHQIKESQNKVLHKTQMLSSGMKGHGSIAGSHMADRRTTFLSGDRVENRLKKPTTFLCKLKFRNELPDPSAQPKLLTLRRDKDRFTRYSITKLEKMNKPELYVEPDLGIPLDLLDLSVYNPPRNERLDLDPEDVELLLDDEPVTPIKKDGLKSKERPTDKGVSWLVKTQYISSVSMESTKLSLTEKQAKELRETRGGRNILDNLNNRERRIQEIEASFEACKTRPVHATNRKLQPVEILPLLPDFDRYEDQFVVTNFDSGPTADSETFGKLDKPVRDAHESQAIMKSFVTTTSDSSKPDKFLAYMVPSVDELSKDMYDEHEDIRFSWVREYHWDVRGDDADDPTTYLVSFGDSVAHYLPLPTKLILRKKRAREGKSSDEIEHFPVPSRVTVRQSSTVSAVELKDSGVYSSAKGSSLNSNRGRADMDDDLGRHQKVVQEADMDQSSGAEYDLSD